MTQKFHNLGEAEKFLLQLASQANAPKMGGEFGLARTRKFLELLGNPQEKLRVIHVAGTSGKGSTSALIAELLKSHGVRVGLHLSPHILDVRERVQVDGEILTEVNFCSYLEDLLPLIEELEKTKFGMPTYFETLVVLAFYSFWKEKVEFAVMETGLGGLLDATNVVNRKNKICVLTRIGLDHTEILGKTYPEIAFQKAGIIHGGNLVVALEQSPEVNQVFAQVAEKKGADLQILVAKKHFLPLEASLEIGNSFDFEWKNVHLLKVQLGIYGDFQIENAALALATFCEVANSNFVLNEVKIRDTLEHFSLPARMQIVQVGKKRFMIDGAHNEQKMQAFLDSLVKLFPKRKFAFLLAFKRGKDFQAMTQCIMKVASHITLTTFFTLNQDMPHLSTSPELVAEFLEKEGFQDYEIVENPEEALQKNLSRMEEMLIVTGSLYLAGEILKTLK